MKRQKRKALIIGGGIAGPVAALLLQQAGIEAEIYEARDTDEDYASSWLIMACNGLNVLKTLGLALPVTAEGSPIPRMRERQAFWRGAQWRPLRGGSPKPGRQARHLEPDSA